MASNGGGDFEIFLDEKAVAKLLGLCPKTLNLWRLQRRGPAFIRCGRSIRYSMRDVRAWIDERTVRPEEE